MRLTHNNGWSKAKVEIASNVSKDFEIFIDAVLEMPRRVKEHYS